MKVGCFFLIMTYLIIDASPFNYLLTDLFRSETNERMHASRRMHLWDECMRAMMPRKALGSSGLERLLWGSEEANA